ncbi:MAG: hypothetical protein H0U62_11705 [Actinobacteria bacterium]|nr:hypothetical protein [Actinomycetota bacterium]
MSTVTGIVSVTTTPPVPVTDANAAVRLVFWVASAGALLLALTGVGAVGATVLSARRAEVAVLRALGMPTGAQARARALELGSVVGVAVGVGVIAGWLIGLAVMPDVATSTTLPGQATLPAGVRLEVPIWLTLLGVGAVAALAIVGFLAARVRAQALDRTYREEIR